MPRDAKSDELERRQKIVVLGEQGAGKTSILCRLIYGEFQEPYMGTIGIDFLSHFITVEGKLVNLQIWDTAGQERFRSLVPTYCRNARGVVLVFDVTEKSALLTIKDWYNTAEAECSAPVFIMVANKIDDTENRVVETAEARKLAKAIGAAYVEVSAKTGHNIKEAFKMLTTCMVRRDTREDDPGEFINVVLTEGTPEEQTNPSCAC